MRQLQLGTALWSLIVFAQSATSAWADDTVIYEAPHYHHASTAAEGFFHGMGYAMRSLGLATKLESEATINWQKARDLAIKNAESYAATFWEMRRMNEQQRAIERGPRLTSDDYARMAAVGKPRLLNPSELDPVTGELAWPVVLQGQEFDAPRQDLDRLFADWAIAGMLDRNKQMRVRQATNLMLGLLHGNIRSLQPMEYMAAQRFLERLAHGGSQPARSVKGLALAHAAERRS
jgi:hypothetical protein